MKKYDVVISLGEQMQKLGIAHDLYTYSIFINCFCRSSQLPLALALLGKMMKLGYEPSIVTFNSLLNGFCHGNRISDAVSLLDQMVEMGYKPNTVTFNTLIHGLFLHNKVSEGVALVERMVAERMSTRFAYLWCVGKWSVQERWEDAAGLLSDMIEKKINPDVVTFNALIDAFVKEGKLLEAEKLYEEMIKSKGCLPNVVTYTTLINGFCKSKRVEDGMELFVRCLKEDWLETQSLTTLLSKGFSKLEIVRVPNKFSTDGFCGVPPDIWTYNILLGWACKNGKLEKALVIFQDMQKSEWNLYFTYSIIIEGMCKAGKVEDAWKLFCSLISKE
ncbi:unnamed protein product [Microthlaspi erraticum]|uniref:Pentacotripeptide-repeat region of PRORP domain-containing protein n=1 Tax=Microthlaspi erraticum TaxID=1685480 RepID=A0A6D2KPH4_9BRAS|nr:unnamed protein product [Microthlaspi erraticum]